MVVVSYSGREINAKLVYYGTGLSGKTTNLEHIYGAIPATSRGKMVSMKTQNDRTLFFDLLPVDLGEISGFKTRFMLYTVPGQVFYNATRKLVLRGADAVVFVADSERGKMEENRESLQNLVDNLREYNLSLDQIPWVIQYNKRDLPEVYSVEELNRELNPKGVPFFEAVATQGNGVFETFRGVSRLLLENLSKELKLSPRANTSASAKGNLLGESFAPAPAPSAATFSDVRMSSPAAPARPVEVEPAAFVASANTESGPTADFPATPPAPMIEPTAAAAASPMSAEAPSPGSASDDSRSAPSLAERFSSWWKSGKKPEDVSQEETAASEAATQVMARPEELTGAASAQVSLPTDNQITLSGSQGPVAFTTSFAPAAEAPSDFESGTFTPSPDVPIVRLPDFSQGFSEAHLPETIPAQPGSKSVLSRSEPAELKQPVADAPLAIEPQAVAQPIAAAADMEKTVRVPVSLHGLKP